MSEEVIRRLERELQRSNALADFVVACMEGMNGRDLFRIREAAHRELATQKAVAFKHHVRGMTSADQDVEHPKDDLQGEAGRVAFRDALGVRCVVERAGNLTPHLWLGVPTPHLGLSGPVGTYTHVQVRCHNEDGGVFTRLEIESDNADVLHDGRMLISQYKLRRLLPILRHFADHGALPPLDQLVRKEVIERARNPQVSQVRETSSNMGDWVDGRGLAPLAGHVDQPERAIRFRYQGEVHLLRHGDCCPVCRGVGYREWGPAGRSDCPACLGESRIDMANRDMTEALERLSEEQVSPGAGSSPTFSPPAPGSGAGEA